MMFTILKTVAWVVSAILIGAAAIICALLAHGLSPIIKALNTRIETERSKTDE